MSEANVKRVTEIVEALAKELGAKPDADLKRLARQLAVDLGVTPSRQPGAKLTPAKVRNIRKLHAEGWKQNALADKYGVTGPAINAIVHRRTWAEVD
jgi:hypothetical protein